MAGLIGKIDEFDSKCEEWKQYEQRLEHYFCTNGVTNEERKRSALITVVGRDNFKLMHSLIHPLEPKDKSYDELIAAMRQHFEPQPSEIMQRFKFHTCRRVCFGAASDCKGLQLRETRTVGTHVTGSYCVRNRK